MNKRKKQLFMVLLSLLLISLAVALGACATRTRTSESKETATVQEESKKDATDNNIDTTKNNDAVENNDTSEAQTSDSVTENSSDEDQTSESSSSTSKKENKKEKSSGSNNSKKKQKSDKPAQKYKTVHHEEEGHYETVYVQKVKCCGRRSGSDGCAVIFDSMDAYSAHQQAYVEKKRKELNDPTYVCTGDHSPAKYVEVEDGQKWVVDKPAWDEQIPIS